MIHKLREVWLIGFVIGLTIWMTDRVFRRMQSGRLFLFRLPFDRTASELERQDAILQAGTWHLLAILAILMMGGLWFYWRTAAKSPRRQNFGKNTLCRSSLFTKNERRLWICRGLLIIATLLDLGTTLWFFHEKSIQLEVHPGIRLFGYAFGRTMGPVLAKGVQLFGILLAGSYLGRWQWLVELLAATLMALAAAHNMLSMS